MVLGHLRLKQPFRTSRRQVLEASGIATLDEPHGFINARG